MNHIDYKVFNSIQDPAAKKIEERYSSLQGMVADSVIIIFLLEYFQIFLQSYFWFQILDNITTILMTYVILFSSDFCSLEDRKEVERTQV